MQPFDAQQSKCEDDGSDLILSLPIGRLVANRYRLERLIGKGGMGAVYKAQDLTLNRPVAIKILIEGKLHSDLWLKRVYREGKAAARLNHPNIISTYDFGVSDAGVAYLVMEFVAGETLRTALSRGPITPANAATWFDQLLSAVEAAHRAGIIHRDLKPENVLIGSDSSGSPVVKVLDFGIAKMLFDDQDASELTLPGSVLGSIQYMSPEQVSGQPVDARSDIFSIGVMIYETLTGRLPFSGNTYTERIISLLQMNVSLPGTNKWDILLSNAVQK
jgi:eukaryotic-like serine/threonine-protein kinase